MTDTSSVRDAVEIDVAPEEGAETLPLGADRNGGSARRRSARARRWIWWIVLFAVVIGTLVAVGGDEPATIEERAADLKNTVACPVCDGQSVSESDAPVAANIRDEIDRRLDDGWTNDEIRTQLVRTYGSDVLLTPAGTGVTGLVWIIPVVAFAGGVAVIAVAFERWRFAAAGEPAGPQPVGPRDQRSRRRWTVVTVTSVLAVGVLAGVLVAAFSGQRLVGQLPTGNDDIRPTDAALITEAQRLFGEGDVLDALETIDQVLADDPDDAEALAWRGWFLVNVPDEETLAAGRRSLDLALEFDPGLPEALLFRAFVHRGDGEPEQALERYEQLLASDRPLPMPLAVLEQQVAELEAELADG